jgi:hypothetical protein
MKQKINFILIIIFNSFLIFSCSKDSKTNWKSTNNESLIIMEAETLTYSGLVLNNEGNEEMVNIVFEIIQSDEITSTSLIYTLKNEKTNEYFSLIQSGISDSLCYFNSDILNLNGSEKSRIEELRELVLKHGYPYRDIEYLKN